MNPLLYDSVSHILLWQLILPTLSSSPHGQWTHKQGPLSNHVIREMGESCSVVSDSLRPHGLYCPWNSPGQNTGVGSLSLLRGSSQPRDRTQVSCITSGFFTSWAQGKPKTTGVDSLSLLQQTFPTQESNQGLQHCRWILYQLSYEGSPWKSIGCYN